MARPLRLEYEDAFYHVIQRGIERKNIFSSDKDKEKFLSYLGASHKMHKAVFHAYVLMNNHYHLIINTPQANLSRIMHYINTSYAAYFNAIHKRAGHLYQGRFKAILVQEDEYLHHLSSYIHLNPLRAAIVKSPDEYTYSSYNFFVSTRKPPEWLNTNFILSLFDKNRSKAGRLYRRFVTEAIGKETDFLADNTKKGFILGDEDFFQSVKNKLINRQESPEIPLLKEIKRTAEPSLEHIKNTVEKHLKNNIRLSRKVSIYLSRKHTQKTLNDIAIFYGNIRYSGISQIWRRVEKKKEEDGDFGKLLTFLESEIIKCQM